jgi:hypothetical protein
MRIVWLVLLLLSALLPTLANDGAVVGEGGRVRLMDGERTDIRMVRESIAIDVFHAFYVVNVDFTFSNDGPDTRVLMGFPERGAGDILPEQYRERVGFQEFSTWVDTVKVTAERRPSSDARDSGYQAYWVKQVSFAKGQVRSIRVRYKAEAGARTNGERWVSYDFTGGTWKGLLDESILTLVLHLPGASIVLPETTGAAAPSALKLDGSRVTAVWNDWQGDGTFNLRYATTDPNWRWIAGVSGGPFDDRVVSMSAPGQPVVMDWLPQAMARGGVTFISFTAFDEAVRLHAKTQKQSFPITTEWDAHTNTATLRAGLTALKVRVGSKELTVEHGGAVQKVALPAAPFMSLPMRGYVSGRLYLPLAAALAALGGMVTVDVKTRELRLAFGEYWNATAAR